MKCKVCRKEEAVLRLHSYNLNLCESCFFEFVENRVKKGIKDFKMFNFDDRILVAVSGGKDSLFLWYVLNKFGYHADGLYIDLGIGEYSKRSKEVVISFAENHNLNLIIKEVKSEFAGNGIEELSKKNHRKACSLCGMIKRHIFNEVAYNDNYSVLATGHNLDDEASTLFGNILNWQTSYINRQYPVLKDSDNKLKKKVKPLIYVSEFETANYCILKGIEYIYEECPLARNATSLFYKDVLNSVELKQKGAKLRFIKGFFKNKNFLKEEEETDLPLRACSVCGFATTQEVCNYCRLKSSVNSK